MDSAAKFLADKKALVNMKYKGAQCFKWRVARELNPVTTHPERVTKRFERTSRIAQFSRN